MRKLDPTDPRVQQAIVLYNSGKAIRPICKELQMDGEALRKVLISQGLLRTRSQAVQNGKGVSYIKCAAFDRLTPEASYWIGFLYADGHIEKAPRTKVSLTLSGKDKDHLDKLNDFIGGQVNIRNVTPKDPTKNPAPGQVNFEGEYYRLAFSNERIHQRLQSLGFTNNKTYDLKPHESLKYSRDFWRGVVDGDGWVCYTNESRYDGRYNRISLGLSGTQETVETFVEFLNINSIPTRATPYKGKGEVFSVEIRGSYADQALSLLYDESCVHLDRKYGMYQSSLN